MRTQFTARQLSDPDFAASEQTLRRCVHCGFCTATCPTYMLLGDELDSPRGRIVLIKEMLEGDRTPAPQTVKHIDRCLSCLSCVTTCPSGVDYMHLIDHAREHIARRYVRPWPDRMLRGLLGAVLSRPALLRVALRTAHLLRPFTRWLPSKIAPALAMVPPAEPSGAGSGLADMRVRADRPRIFPATGPRRGRVALLGGCAQAVLAPSINAAAVRLLNRHGIEVIIADGSECCGALNHHLGDSKRSHALARANIRAWQREIEGAGLDAIIMTTSGCGTMVKDYGYLFRDDPEIRESAAAVASLARDISEYVATLELAPQTAQPQGLRALRVAYQSPCSMHHGQKITRLPIDLLSSVGFDARPLPEAHVCCGSAGTYNLLQPEIAGILRARKQALIAAAEPDVVASGNVGCMMQLAQNGSVPIVHTVELLDWATGGPMPSRLRSLLPSEARTS